MSELLPDAAGAVGEALEDDEEAGALLEPLAALPLGCDGAALELELDEPPEAPAAGALGVAALEELDELLSLLLVSTDAEPETLELEPDGAVDAEPDGEVVEPADEDEPGVVR